MSKEEQCKNSKAKGQSKTHWAEMFYGFRKEDTDRKCQEESSWKTKLDKFRAILHDKRNSDAFRLLMAEEWNESK